MTHSQIKQSRAAGNSNWEILHELVTEGFEFPDASYRVACALRMDEEERLCMEADYNECV